MALYRRGGVWWYEFIFAGKRVRESARTTKKTIAREAETKKRSELERALAGIPAEKPENRIRSVAEALRDYQKHYPVNHRPGSVAIVKERSVHLNRILGTVLLSDLSSDRIVGYMATRLAEKVSNRTVNMELMVLSRAVGLPWRLLWPKVRKLEENRDAGRALETAEEEAVLKAAAANRSRMLYPFLMTLVWTGVRSDEARTLRWSQVDFAAGEVVIGKAKTEAGTRRVIPMSGPLRAALNQHAAFCGEKLGPVRPEWYVFPFSNRTRPIDPTEPVTSLKRGWEAVQETSGVSCRLHDLRHSFCTKLAEAGVPESTMLDMMGHVSSAMLRRYSHIRAKARRDAIAALEHGTLFGVPTKSPTKEDSRSPNPNASAFFS